MEDARQSEGRRDSAVGDTGKTIDELAAQFTAINRSQAVIEFDPHGRILWANDNFLRAMGYRSDQIIGQHHRMFMPRDDVGSSEYGEFWRQLGRGEFFTGRFRRVDGRGNELWLQASYNPIFDDHGRVIKVIKFAMDVTEDEMQKADATGQLQAISKVQAIIEFDLEGRILAANDLFLYTMGYQSSEVVGKHHSMFVVPGSITQGEYKAFWARLARGHFEQGTYHRMGKNRRDVWIDASYNPIMDPQGRPFKVVKYATDVTDRYLAVETLASTVSALSESVTRVQQASRLVQKSEDIAKLGGGKLTQLVEDMENLSKSSQKVVEIISVVNEIALQTNLLALNASVEASRAGDAGRGFAVVAQEVRSLAQRTAAAAKQVKDLISQSVDQIQVNSDAVANSGGTMKDIVESILEVNSLMDAISATTSSQANELQVVSDRLQGGGHRSKAR